MQARVSLGDLSSVLAGEVRRRIADGGLTGVGLAERAGLSQSFVCNWLGGRRDLGLHSAECVMVALRIDRDEVLAGCLQLKAVPRRRLFLVPAGPGAGLRVPAAVAGLRAAA